MANHFFFLPVSNGWRNDTFGSCSIFVFQTNGFRILTGKSFSICLFEELTIGKTDCAANPNHLVQVNQCEEDMIESNSPSEDGCCQLGRIDGHCQDALAIRFHGGNRYNFKKSTFGFCGMTKYGKEDEGRTGDEQTQIPTERCRTVIMWNQNHYQDFTHHSLHSLHFTHLLIYRIVSIRYFGLLLPCPFAFFDST